MLLTARAGALAGDSALYQLLERPSPGRFTFAQEEHPAPTAKGDSPREMVPILLEGMRRYDELIRATALVPDDGRYRATDHRPEKPPDETDTDFVRLVWDGAANGVTPAACEAKVGVDSFRVRRLYERWVTDGALVPRGAGD